MYRTPAARMTAARTRLLLDFPWFGALAMRLRIEPSEDCKTFRTDGTVLQYNPAALENYTEPELTAVTAHEVMHCALLHPYRRGNRDLKLWNLATDYAINGELLKAGLSLPKGVKIDPQYDGLSAEVIYARLSQNPPPGGDQETEPSTGTVQDAPPEGQGKPGDGAGAPGDSQGQPQPAQGEPQRMTADDWKIAAEQASSVGRKAGCLPGNAADLVKKAAQEPADWRTILREFIEQTTPSDYSWMAPNRRYIAQGVYLPGVVKEGMGILAVAVDTSASIDAELLAAFCQEVNAIIRECHPEALKVIYCDSKVHRQEEYTADDEITLTAAGRGGTKFQPVFDAVAEWPEPPACLIYLTDLDSSDKPTEPADYPVLWAVDFAQVTQPAPFGGTVELRP